MFKSCLVGLIRILNIGGDWGCGRVLVKRIGKALGIQYRLVVDGSLVYFWYISRKRVMVARSGVQWFGTC